MHIETTPIQGLYLVDLAPASDQRGSFTRIYSRDTFAELGLETHIEEASVSRTQGTGTLRGLHYQHSPHAETKGIHCLVGSIFDVVVDLRDDTLATFTVELTAEQPRLLVVPEGCAHGFQTLTDTVYVNYLMSRAYAPEFEGALRWDDPALDIDWPILPPILSERDRSLPDWRAGTTWTGPTTSAREGDQPPRR